MTFRSDVEGLHAKIDELERALAARDRDLEERARVLNEVEQRLRDQPPTKESLLEAQIVATEQETEALRAQLAARQARPFLGSRPGSPSASPRLLLLVLVAVYVLHWSYAMWRDW